MKNSNPLIHRIVLSLVTSLGAWTTPLHAQPGSQDTHFNAAAITGQIGFSVAVQPDGKVIAVGTFGVIRFLDNGAVDPAFQAVPSGASEWSGPGQGLGAVALQPDGRIVVTGNFTNSAGVPLPGVFRLNTDGSLDPSFNLGPRIYPAGRVLALQPDGKIVSSGLYFGSSPGDDARSGLLRLRPDGSLDPGFDIRESDISRELHGLALTPEGKIYSVESSQVARSNPDGSRDEAFYAEPNHSPFGSIAVQPDGKVLIGAYSDGLGFRAVLRLLPDGTEDPDWIAPQVSGGDSVVYALLLQPDGKVLVGGANLMGFNGMLYEDIGRLNTDGTLDTNFNSYGDLHFYGTEDMAFAPDGKIVVAGYQLNRPDITAAPGVWRLNNDISPRGIEFAAASYIAREGDGWVNLPVRRSTGTNRLAIASYSVRPSTATRWRDYFGGDGVLVFHPGETLQHIRLYVVRDRRPENYETVRLTLTRARGGSFGPQKQTILTILDK